MKLLVVGSGGREHALVWKLRQDPGGSEVLCAPGNPGIARLARCLPVAATDVDALRALARAEAVDLTVVGPEAPLALGIVDRFRAEGLPIFGPSREAARLESSKSFAKRLMEGAGVPTARYRVAETPGDARAAIDELGGAVALKADGLAAGKGVMVASTVAEALAAVDALMVQRRVGDAGRTLVVEERLEGPEVSYFAVVDGVRAVGLGSAQDHKRAFDGDRGPNTGGMGAFSPSPLVTPDLDARIMRDIVAPVAEALRREGTPFVGFLYAGLMLTADGPRVIEFNVRLGDPEAQVVLPRLTAPLAPILLAAARGRLEEAPAIEICDSKPVGVVLASRGYPDQVETGHPIEGLEDAEALDHVLVFHAGTRVEAGRVVTAGGRVLTVVGGGDTFEAARGRAYAGVRAIRFEGCYARTDIGLKALSP